LDSNFDFVKGSMMHLGSMRDSMRDSSLGSMMGSSKVKETDSMRDSGLGSMTGIMMHWGSSSETEKEIKKVKAHQLLE